MTGVLKVSDLTNVPSVDKMYVGIDPSLTCTGVAIIQNGALTTTSLKPKLRGAERLNWFHHWFMSRIDQRETAGLAIEGYAFSATNQLPQLGELGGVLRLAFFRLGMSYTVVPPATLKKFATGKGSGEKGMVSKELFKRFSVDVGSNDEADAAALALFAMARDGHDLGLTKPQLETLEKGEHHPATVAK